MDLNISTWKLRIYFDHNQTFASHLELNLSLCMILELWEREIKGSPRAGVDTALRCPFYRKTAEEPFKVLRMHEPVHSFSWRLKKFHIYDITGVTIGAIRRSEMGTCQGLRCRLSDRWDVPLCYSRESILFLLRVRKVHCSTCRRIWLMVLFSQWAISVYLSSNTEI